MYGLQITPETTMFWSSFPSRVVMGNLGVTEHTIAIPSSPLV